MKGEAICNTNNLQLIQNTQRAHTNQYEKDNPYKGKLYETSYWKTTFHLLGHVYHCSGNLLIYIHNCHMYIVRTRGTVIELSDALLLNKELLKKKITHNLVWTKLKLFSLYKNTTKILCGSFMLGALSLTGESNCVRLFRQK